MKKDCIQDFIAAWKQYDTSTMKYQTPYWNGRFKDAGYYPVDVSNSMYNWSSIHAWCEEKFTKNHYAWAGSTFWFESEQDAIMFTLRWL
jgi:hypothetical protein